MSDFIDLVPFRKNYIRSSDGMTDSLDIMINVTIFKIKHLIKKKIHPEMILTKWWTFNLISSTFNLFK